MRFQSDAKKCAAAEASRCVTKKMTPEKTIDQLMEYRSELSGIMKRFAQSPGDYSIRSEDDPRYRTIVIEVVDLINDSLGDNKYSQLIYQMFNVGIQNYLQSPSYKSIEDIVSVIDPAITWIKRNADKLTAKVEQKTTEPIKSELNPPDRVTLKWLWEHVPYTLWVFFIGLLISAFTLGVTFADTKLYKSAISLLTPNSSAYNKTTPTK